MWRELGESILTVRRVQRAPEQVEVFHRARPFALGERLIAPERFPAAPGRVDSKNRSPPVARVAPLLCEEDFKLQFHDQRDGISRLTWTPGV